MERHNTQTAWWSYGHVWLVIAGPLLVVIASFVSAFIAFQGNDTVLRTRDEAEIAATRALQANADRNWVPAVQARNHAATPEGTPLRKQP
jgi:hypothetical protein